jgi:hypothetical protein
MTRETGPLALIRTLPLENGNYGGLLQAYALQTHLRKLGLEPVTDTARRFDRRGWKYRAKHAARTGLLSLGYHNAEWIDRAARAKDEPLVAEFARDHLTTVDLFTHSGTVDEELVAATDVFVVGSDQVWRRRYTDVRSYLFDFLDIGDNRPRLSYAASFGRDDLAEYDSSLCDDAAVLLGRFDAVSVREESGVQLVHRLADVPAEHHIDPTLLLPRSHYEELAADRAADVTAGSLVDYVLDNSASARRIVQEVASRFGSATVSLIPETARSYRELSANPERFARPTVETWLATIAAAGFVVTDSFHGTVFAILHNVPFISVVNANRGAARFESLLKMFDLQDRLVRPDERVDLALVERSISWTETNARIDQERARADDYLTRALAPTFERHRRQIRA